LPNGEPDYDWGGTGHEDTEKVIILDLPFNATNVEGAPLGIHDRIAYFDIGTTVAADDEVLTSSGSLYYRVLGPVEDTDFLDIGLKKAYLKYQGT